jgi:hypothetical protein
MRDPETSATWTLRQRVAATCFVVVLVVQFAIPLSRLAEPRPARFGWHMYSDVLDSVQYSVDLGAGSVVPVELRDVVINPRGDQR